MSEARTVTDLVDRLPARPHAATQMPAKIAASIIKVKKQVKQLGQDGNNSFAKFRYVSVDKFYDVIGRLMADAGLFVVTDETNITAETRETQTDNGAVKRSVWITATYELYLFHETGEQYGPVHRTIMVPATGPQAFGSGMSYVEKYFLRSLFKVPTGEEDADAAEQTGVPSGNAAPANGARISAEQKSEIVALLKKCDPDGADPGFTGRFLKHMGATTVDQLRATQFADAVEALENKIASKAKT